MALPKLGQIGRSVGLGALILVLAGAAFVALPLWAMWDRNPNGSSPGCAVSAQVIAMLPPTQTATFKLTDPNAATTHTLAFGRSRGTRTISVELSPESASTTATTAALPASEHPFAVVTSPFTRSDDETLNPNLITTNASIEGGRVLVTVCAQRGTKKDGSLGPAGAYTGTVSVASSDILRSDIQVKMTLAYPAWQLVLELLVLVLIPASWYLWVLHAKKANTKWFVDGAFVEYTFSILGIVSLAVGTTAGFAVFTATYLSSDSWGSAGLQPLALYGTMFTAFVTAASGVHLGHKAVSLSASAT